MTWPLPDAAETELAIVGGDTKTGVSVVVLSPDTYRALREAAMAGEKVAEYLGRSSYTGRELVQEIKDLRRPDPDRAGLIDELEQVDDRVGELMAEVEILKAVHGEAWPHDFPPRPELNCVCGECSCRLHVFPGDGDREVCAWCRRGIHDDRPGIGELPEVFESVSTAEAFERLAKKVELGEQISDPETIVARHDLAIVLDELGSVKPHMADGTHLEA